MPTYAALPAWIRPFAPFLQCWPQVDRSTLRDDAMAGVAGALIAASQIKNLFGLSIPRGTSFSDMLRQMVGQLDATVQSLRVEGAEAASRIAHGTPAATLVARAHELGADLVVVGTYPGGRNRLLPTGISANLIGAGTCRC